MEPEIEEGFEPFTPEEDAETTEFADSLSELERRETMKGLLLDKLKSMRDRNEMYQQMSRESP